MRDKKWIIGDRNGAEDAEKIFSFFLRRDNHRLLLSICAISRTAVNAIQDNGWCIE